MFEKPLILYDNLIEEATTLTATATETGFDVLNLKDPRIFMEWMGVGTTLHRVTANLPASRSADCFGLINHNLASIGATLSIECSSDNFASDVNVALAGFTPPSDGAFVRKFTSWNKPDWRMTMTDMTAAPLLGAVKIGNKLEFPWNPEKRFIPDPEKVIGSSSRGRKGGHHLGSVVENIELNPRPKWRNVSPDWIKNNFKPVWNSHLSMLKPFFWAWEPNEHDDEVYYVKIPDKFALKMPYNPVLRDLSLQVEAMKEL